VAKCLFWNEISMTQLTPFEYIMAIITNAVLIFRQYFDALFSAAVRRKKMNAVLSLARQFCF
jgi:hypothetical protein